jgi:hypothetical protein
MENKLRDYQIDISEKAVVTLSNNYIVYLAMQVRTGKTITALETAKLYGAENVLFLTKKKAIKSIEKDYKDFGYTFKLTVINNESLHLLPQYDFDLIIMDEAHRFGAYPKPSKGCKLFKEKFKHLPMIFLSGTPTPESNSQIYHQMWVSNNSPFKSWQNFYKWAQVFVNVKKVNLGYATINDYSDAKKTVIDNFINPIMINYTQEEAGFKTVISEQILYVQMSDYTYSLAKRLKKDKVIQGKEEVILADTGVKEMQKLHQIYSGTCKFESGNSMILDKSKAEFIKKNFGNTKIGIFYKFKEEWNMLKSVYGDLLTDNLEEFDSTNKSIALQIISGREGISLKNADSLVYLNIDFSATSYWQSRDRLTTKDRLRNDVYWIFAKGGIEDNIYKAVVKKKNFTSSYYDKIKHTF